MTGDEAAAARPAMREGVLAVLYLGLAACVEGIVAHVAPFDALPSAVALRVAVLLDGLLLTALMVHGALELAGHRPAFGRLLMALSMVPLARVVAQALTASVTLPEMGLYLRYFTRLLLVALVLSAALYFLLRADRASLARLPPKGPEQEGSRAASVLIGLAVLLAAPAVGLAAFALLDPVIPTAEADDPQLAVAVVILVVAALWQELTFRGLVLHDANRVFGWAGATGLAGLAGTIPLIGTVPALDAQAWLVLALQLVFGTALAAQVQASRHLAVAIVAQALLQVSFFLVAPHYL